MTIIRMDQHQEKQDGSGWATQFRPWMTDLAYVLPVEDVWGEYGAGTAQEQEGYEESESCLFRFLW